MAERNNDKQKRKCSEIEVGEVEGQPNTPTEASAQDISAAIRSRAKKPRTLPSTTKKKETRKKSFKVDSPSKAFTPQDPGTSRYLPNTYDSEAALPAWSYTHEAIRSLPAAPHPHQHYPNHNDIVPTIGPGICYRCVQPCGGFWVFYPPDVAEDILNYLRRPAPRYGVDRADPSRGTNVLSNGSAESLRSMLSRYHGPSYANQLLALPTAQTTHMGVEWEGSYASTPSTSATSGLTSYPSTALPSEPERESRFQTRIPLYGEGTNRYINNQKLLDFRTGSSTGTNLNTMPAPYPSTGALEKSGYIQENTNRTPQNSETFSFEAGSSMNPNPGFTGGYDYLYPYRLPPWSQLDIPNEPLLPERDLVILCPEEETEDGPQRNAIKPSQEESVERTSLAAVSYRQSSLSLELISGMQNAIKEEPPQDPYIPDES